MKKVKFVGGPIHGKTQHLPDVMFEVASPLDETDEKGEIKLFSYKIIEIRYGGSEPEYYGVNKEETIFIGVGNEGIQPSIDF